jgi:hypothetical protein
MVRLQVQLPEMQVQALRRWADKLDISLSEAVRRSVAERLAREEGAPSREVQVRAALAVCGRYRDPAGRSRVAVDHDRHLAEAYGPAHK